MVAVLSQVAALFSLGRLPTSCVVTILHQILLIHLIFVPMFFQIESIVSPKPLTWLLALGMALLIEIGLLFISRGAQL